jgi:hypothetical protein
VNEFGLSANDEALDYMRQIAAEMQALFGVSADDAAARIGTFWRGAGSFRTESELTALLHDPPSSWAKTIYHGHRDWWRSAEP